MLDNDLLYQLPLTMLPGIWSVQAKVLLQHNDAAEIFTAKKSSLEKMKVISQ